MDQESPTGYEERMGSAGTWLANEPDHVHDCLETLGSCVCVFENWQIEAQGIQRRDCRRICGGLCKECIVLACVCSSWCLLSTSLGNCVWVVWYRWLGFQNHLLGLEESARVRGGEVILENRTVGGDRGRWVYY